MTGLGWNKEKFMDPNPREAVKWLTKLAESSKPEAKEMIALARFDLSMIYSKGAEGSEETKVEKNLSKSIMWLGQAADLMHRQALYILGILRSKGVPNELEKDLKKAILCYTTLLGALTEETLTNTFNRIYSENGEFKFWDPGNECEDIKPFNLIDISTRLTNCLNELRLEAEQHAVAKAKLETA